MAIFFFFFFFFWYRKKYRVLGIFVIISVVWVIFSPYLFETVFREIIITVQNLPELLNPRATPYDELLSSRFYFWRKLLTTYVYKSNIINILFGFGYDLPVRHLYVTEAHNHILELMFKFGTVSLVLFYGCFIPRLICFGLKHNRDLLSNISNSYFLALILSSLASAVFSDVRSLWFFGVYLGIFVKYHELHHDIPVVDDAVEPSINALRSA